MKVIKKIVPILVIVVILIIPLLGIVNPTITVKKELILEIKEDINLKKAGFWNLTGSHIFINGTATGVDAHNWSWVEDQIWFGGGNGNWDNPYLIENITIDSLGTGSSIKIINSDKYFIIKNCTAYNAGTDLNDLNDAGIHFTNISNGQIINCSTSFNLNGIVLLNSSDCLINDCYIIDNGLLYGILIDVYSYNNKIIHNTFIEETVRPEAFISGGSTCYYTEISRNIFISIRGRAEAMEFYGGYYMNISNNRLLSRHLIGRGGSHCYE